MTAEKARQKAAIKKKAKLWREFKKATSDINKKIKSVVNEGLTTCAIFDVNPVFRELLAEYYQERGYDAELKVADFEYVLILRWGKKVDDSKEEPAEENELEVNTQSTAALILKFLLFWVVLVAIGTGAVFTAIWLVGLFGLTGIAETIVLIILSVMIFPPLAALFLSWFSDRLGITSINKKD